MSLHLPHDLLGVLAHWEGQLVLLKWSKLGSFLKGFFLDINTFVTVAVSQGL